MKVQVYKNRFFWRVKLVATNGEILMVSETYYNRSNAVRAAQRLRGAAGNQSMTSEDQMFDHPGHDQHYQPYDSAGNEYGKLEPGSLNVKEGEYHPAADSAMAWLKGYICCSTRPST